MTEHDPQHDGPSLAWFGRPPVEHLDGSSERAPADRVRSDNVPDIYGRVVVSALVVGGALLLARSRSFRRVAWQVARFALVSWLPARLVAEVRQAWRDAAPEEPPAGDLPGSQ